ncbi:MAG: CinA family nicotinamide mononucleotide deamidase-related protein [Rhodopirellula sp.]|nr:CinA family nicotinamide mononucleotide deamidase-related protein [Rhodopirellula sp.]
MKAEILSIGDEITSGQLLDTNAQWLSRRLEEMGVRVLYHTTVGDELDAIVAAFRAAIQRCDVILATGGLGPTADDLTREAIARAAGRDLLVREEALDHIRALFARRRREMPERNTVQAFFPVGSQIIPNPNGTAPGIDITIERSAGSPARIFALPGVPAEMIEMWNETVAPRLRLGGAGQRTVRHRKIRCFGAGESQIEAMLPDLIRRGRIPRVGINASKATIILRITAEGATPEECDAAIEPTAATIYQCLGDLVFGEGEEELQHAVVRLLRRAGRTLATAEWGTAGLLADWLGEMAASDDCYLGGTIVSSISSLEKIISLPPEGEKTLEADPAEVAKAMAERCRRQFGADYTLAVSRFPFADGPSGEPEQVFLALASADSVQAKSLPFAGHPALLKVYIAKQALNFARLALLADLRRVNPAVPA